MLQLPSRFQDIIAAGCPHPAVLWDIVRVDGVTKRFTSHNRRITYDGNIYYPSNSVEASARQSRSGLKDENLSLVGAIDSVEITDHDLRAGKYRDADVIERLVDWKLPWLGVLFTNTYIIRETTYTGESWEATVSSAANQLTVQTGDYYARNCRYDLGDSRCGVDLNDYTESGTVTTVTDRYRFNSTCSAAVAHNNTGSDDNYFKGGKLTWLTGNNAGTVSEVKNFVQSTGRFNLQFKLPFDIETGDTFTVHRGCLKRLEDCMLFQDYISNPGTPAMNNRKNYGGFPTIPHTAEANDTPDFPEIE